MPSKKEEVLLSGVGKIKSEPLKFVLYLASILVGAGVVSLVVSLYNLVIAVVMFVGIFVLGLIALYIYYRQAQPPLETREDFIKKHLNETLYFRLSNNQIVEGKIVRFIPSEVVIETEQRKKERILTTSIREISFDLSQLTRKP